MREKRRGRAKVGDLDDILAARCADRNNLMSLNGQKMK